MPHTAEFQINYETFVFLIKQEDELILLNTIYFEYHAVGLTLFVGIFLYCVKVALIFGVEIMGQFLRRGFIEKRLYVSFHLFAL